MFKTLALGLIRLYQIMVRPILPSACVFDPSCSVYTYQAIEKYGVIKGSWLGAKRIARCHPFQKHRHDPLV